MPLDVLLGLQWGDEGKGKIVDFLTPNYNIIARFQGGPNAGHTLEFSGSKHILHLIPSGIFHPDKKNLIGNGVIIDPHILMHEIDQLSQSHSGITERLLISRKAHLILPTHRLLDLVSELSKGSSKIGSTLKGIGPAYSDKTGRNGIRVGHIFDKDFKEQYQKLRDWHLKLIEFFGIDLEGIRIEKNYTLDQYEERWFTAVERMKDLHLVDSEYYINQALQAGQRILAEGAQGTMLDIDFGTYPFVTSSNTITSGVCSGLGIAPVHIGKVFGIAKAYCTRVGSGPFPTELFDSQGQELRDQGNEYGSTTGRPRRCGWLDLPALRYAIMINGVSDIILTKADVLNNFESIKACENYIINGQKTPQVPFQVLNENILPDYREFTGWQQSLDNIRDFEGLPPALSGYIAYIEQQTGVPVSIVSTGADRNAIIVKDNFLHL